MGYQKAVVAFLDVLGTKHNQDFESKYKIHRAFHESMAAIAARDRTSAAYYRRSFSFSDCAYIFHGFRDTTPDEHLDEDKLIQTALFNTSLTMIRLLSEGYLLRGGISFGDAHVDDLSFFGSAVEQAYKLESTEAIVPRVMIDATLGERARGYSIAAHEECFAPERQDISAMPPRSHLPELVQCQNDAFHLNPFYILEMGGRLDLDGREFTHAGVTQAVASAIDEKIQRFAWENPVRAKLEWMREYVGRSRCSVKEPW